MGDQFRQLDDKQISFIRDQQLFFVGTAGAEGFVNVSPKGMDSFRVLNENRIAWLNLTGSGNESASHVLENRRMTVMFCSFDKSPLILRLYGDATVVHERDPEWQELVGLFPDFSGARQVFVLNIEMVQTSCGFAVPYFESQGERPTLARWAEKKGKEGIVEFQKKHNLKDLNGRSTGLFESELSE